MEIILQQDTPKLGYKNDVVTVKAGYARNYLIPRGIAVEASKANRKTAEQNVQQAAKKADAIKEQALALVEQLGDQPIVVRVKAGSEGRIFGTVTAGQIAEAIKNAHAVAIEPRVIHLAKPIKTLGEHTATLTLHREVTHALPLLVEEESA